jgi:hypothetical protein
VQLQQQQAERLLSPLTQQQQKAGQQLWQTHWQQPQRRQRQ